MFQYLNQVIINKVYSYDIIWGMAMVFSYLPRVAARADFDFLCWSCSPFVWIVPADWLLRLSNKTEVGPAF